MKSMQNSTIAGSAMQGITGTTYSCRQPANSLTTVYLGPTHYLSSHHATYHRRASRAQ